MPDGTVGFYIATRGDPKPPASLDALADQRRRERLDRARLAHSAQFELDPDKLKRAEMATHASGSLLDVAACLGLESGDVSRPSAPGQQPPGLSVEEEEADLPPLPTFVKVDKLRRNRSCLGLRRAPSFTAHYSAFNAEVDATSIISPTEAKRQLTCGYTSFLGAGFDHEEALDELRAGQ